MKTDEWHKGFRIGVICAIGTITLIGIVVIIALAKYMR
jgi:hypothetical protein